MFCVNIAVQLSVMSTTIPRLRDVVQQAAEDKEIYELKVRLRELLTEHLSTDEGKKRLLAERERRIQHAKDEQLKQEARVRYRRCDRVSFPVV